MERVTARRVKNPGIDSDVFEIVAEIDGVRCDPQIHQFDGAALIRCGCLFEDAPAILDMLEAAHNALAVTRIDPRTQEEKDACALMITKHRDMQARDDLSVDDKIDSALAQAIPHWRKMALQAARARARGKTTIREGALFTEHGITLIEDKEETRDA